MTFKQLNNFCLDANKETNNPADNEKLIKPLVQTENSKNTSKHFSFFII